MENLETTAGGRERLIGLVLGGLAGALLAQPVGLQWFHDKLAETLVATVFAITFAGVLLGAIYGVLVGGTPGAVIGAILGIPSGFCCWGVSIFVASLVHLYIKCQVGWESVPSLKNWWPCFATAGFLMGAAAGHTLGLIVFQIKSRSASRSNRRSEGDPTPAN